MADLDKLIYFSCPDGCGQIGVACSIRMILDDAPFFCESCGCEFHGKDFPDWLANAACGPEQSKSPEYEIMVTLFSYLHANGTCPSANIISQLIAADRALWKLFPAEKLAPADILNLLQEEEFRSRLDCSRLDCACFTGLLTSRPDLLVSMPELASFCHWDELTSTEWAMLLTALPDSKLLQTHCDWEKIKEPDWKKILRNGKNDFAIAVYRVRHGRSIITSIKKFPELQTHINWAAVTAVEWLNSLVEFPQFVNKFPWSKMYDYIVGLPPEQRRSFKEQFPELWKKKSEILSRADFPELLKLSAEKYYTVLDYFDWEDFFDYPSLSREDRIDLFSKHPQFAERFGWDNIPSDEKVLMAVRCAEFGKYYGWNKFTEEETLNILKEKPDWLRYFESANFSRSFWMKLGQLNETFSDRFQLNFFDYLLFRKFDSKKLCAKITFAWHFVISLMAFAGLGYLMLDGPCGFKAFWTGSHANAFMAAAVYFTLSILWSWIHAWVYSGRTPFFLTVVSALFGAGLAAVQFFYTLFLSKITLSNYVSWAIVSMLVLVLIMMRSSNGELFDDNKSGIAALGFFYLPALLISIVICQPCFHWQYLRVYGQLERSARPFRSASQYYLQKALKSDAETQALIGEFDQALKKGDYEAGKDLFARIPSIYASAQEIKKLAEDLEILRKNQLPQRTEAAIAAYKRQDYAKLKSIIHGADPENAEIQFILGKCFHLGLGGHKIDYARAAEWYEKAVIQGHSGAMNNLGTLYMAGKGVAKSPEKALSLYRSAAEAGNVVAQRNLACLYLDGTVVKKDLPSAYYWFLEAAKQDDPVSQRQVALMSYCSMGTECNNETVLLWLKKAADKDDTLAQQMLGAFYLLGTLGVKDQKSAISLLTKAAEKNDAAAQSMLGLCYAEGSGGVEVNGKSAVHWLTKAARQDEAEAQYSLFKVYFLGKIVPKNVPLAIEWLKKSAGKNPAAQFALGACYWNGDGVARDQVQAEYWFRKAAENGHQQAKETLKQIQQKDKTVRRRRRRNSPSRP